MKNVFKKYAHISMTNIILKFHVDVQEKFDICCENINKHLKLYLKLII